MRIGDLFAKTGIAAMGLTLIAVVVMIFGVVVGNGAGIVAGVLVFVLYALAWVALPLGLLRRASAAAGGLDAVTLRHTDWLLTKSERANAQTRLDARHDGEVAWSEGNLVRPLVHGATYFAELYDRLEETRAWRPGVLHRLAGRRRRAPDRRARERGRRGARSRPTSGGSTSAG